MRIHNILKLVKEQALATTKVCHGFNGGKLAFSFLSLSYGKI